MSDQGGSHYCLGMKLRETEKSVPSSWTKRLHQRNPWAFQHGIMQTGHNSIQCKFKIIKTLGWGIWECAKGNGRCSIQGQGWISHVNNGGHESQFCICSEYGEPIHVEGQFTILDGCEMHHEVFEGHFRFQIVLRGRGFYDANWVGDARSTTRYVFILLALESFNENAILKQPTIALFTTEMEYMATSRCTKKVVWLRQLLADVGYVQEGWTFIRWDNQRCIPLAKNPTHHYCTKHIDVQHHFIREKLKTDRYVWSFVQRRIW